MAASDEDVRPWRVLVLLNGPREIEQSWHSGHLWAL